MSKPVSLFTGYSQKENRVTNYVLLMLRMLYEDSPSYLNQLFGELFPEDISNIIGVSFNQQVRKGVGVPDGLITQKALSIHIEAKNHDWFYDSQIERHLADLEKEEHGTKVLMLLGNIEADLESRFQDIKEKTKKKYGDKIYFEVVTFEDLLTALNTLKLPKRLQDSVDEIEYFFNEESLLPRWKGMLDVVNCTGSLDEVVEHGVYSCPTSGGAYSHKRCMYFGAYSNKKVETVCEIRAIIDYEKGDEAVISWINTNESQDALIAEGIEKINNIAEVRDSVRIFLLGERYTTNFIKDTRGGMQQSKLYFEVASLEANDAKHLAELLNTYKWSDLR